MSTPMNPYQAPTANVYRADDADTHYGYSGFWRRWAAYFIDYVLVTIATYAIILPLGFVAGMSSGSIVTGDPDVFGSAMGFVFIIISIGITSTYYAYMESTQKGATIGKMAVGIAVKRSDGTRMSLARGYGRFFARIVSAVILFIGYLMQPFTGKKQALHDMITDTVVVRTSDQGPVVVAIILVVSLIIPLAVIGILAAIAIPAYQGYVERAKRSSSMLTPPAIVRVVQHEPLRVPATVWYM